MLHVPDGSIYYWMFTQGLKHTPLDHILVACKGHDKDVRQKDIDNYWRGYQRSTIGWERRSILDIPPAPVESNSRRYFEKGYQDYEIHPYLGIPDPMERYVPCSKDNKPLVKWGGALFTYDKACDYPETKYIAENLKDCKFIVIDCDGDHDMYLDLETIEFLWKYACKTHRLDKPRTIPEYDCHEDDVLHAGMPASFHLTFRVDRLIPTMHFAKAHIDIIGNLKNSLRYFKDKTWNGREPIDMTPEIWEDIKAYIRKREEQ